MVQESGRRSAWQARETDRVRHRASGEQVLNLVSGQYDDRPGLLFVVTDRRLFCQVRPAVGVDEFGKDGLSDMAAAVAKDIKRLPVSHIVIASDHSHAGRAPAA